jgi:hypothetical protein
VNVSVVKTVEELKASIKSRSFPTIVVEGQLAGNIVASRILAPLNGDRATYSGPAGNQEKAALTPTYEVIQLLRELSLHHVIDVLDGPGGPRIKIHPVSVPRREGN